MLIFGVHMKFTLLFALVFCTLILGQNPEWLVYNTLNSPLKSNNIRDIEIDKFNNKWILSDSGLTKISADNIWTHYSSFLGLFNFSEARFMTSDNEGYIWLGGYIGNSIGIIKFNGEFFYQYKSSSSGLPHDVAHSISIDHNNNVYVLCGIPMPNNNTYLAKFNGNFWQTYQGHFFYDDAGEISALDSQGMLWTADQTGLWKFDGTNYTQMASGSFSGYLSDMIFDAEGNLWSAQGSCGWAGLRKFKDGVITYFDQYLAVSLATEAQTLWVGTAGFVVEGELLRYRNGNFVSFNSSNSLLPVNRSVKSLKIDKLGNLWIGLQKNKSHFKYS